MTVASAAGSRWTACPPRRRRRRWCSRPTVPARVRLRLRRRHVDVPRRGVHRRGGQGHVPRHGCRGRVHVGEVGRPQPANIESKRISRILLFKTSHSLSALFVLDWLSCTGFAIDGSVAAFTAALSTSGHVIVHIRGPSPPVLHSLQSQMSHGSLG
jgi:hypothetical protein